MPLKHVWGTQILGIRNFIFFCVYFWTIYCNCVWCLSKEKFLFKPPRFDLFNKIISSECTTFGVKVHVKSMNRLRFREIVSVISKINNNKIIFYNTNFRLCLSRKLSTNRARSRIYTQSLSSKIDSKMTFNPTFR